jgi:hypothetical protein
MAENRTLYQCPVCGYGGLDEPAYDPKSGLGSYDVCASCGYEYGVTDDDLEISHDEWRRRWIKGGMQWWASEIQAPPQGWDPIAQLATLRQRGC